MDNSDEMKKPRRMKLGIPRMIKDFLDDLKRKEFIPIKILYFLIHGAMISLLPFMTLHARSLGITESELGTIGGILPILGVLAPAAAGVLADKIGNFKIYLSATLALSGLTVLMFLIVPPASVTYTLPDTLPLQIYCNDTGTIIQPVYPYECEFSKVSETPMQIQECEHQCSKERTIPVGDDTLFLNGAFASIVASQSNQTRFRRSDICPDTQRLQQKTLDGNCWLVCNATASSSSLCSNTQTTKEGNRLLTLSIYVTVRIFNAITLACSMPLFEGAVVAIILEKKGDFGFQKLFGNIGQIVLTPISGTLIDHFSNGDQANFRPAFYMYCVIKILCAFIILFMDLKFRTASKTIVKDLRILICKLEVITFLSLGIFSGLAMGIIGTFLFWLMEDLGASKSLMGITLTVGASFGIPMMFFSRIIIRKLGHPATLLLAFSFYSVRLLGFSLISDPWMVMPFEALECFTMGLFGVAAVSYSSHLASSKTFASLQGIFGGLFFGVGMGSGSLVGGFMVSSFGIRTSFQFFAGICAIVAVLYGLCTFFLVRRRKTKKEEGIDELELGEERKK